MRKVFVSICVFVFSAVILSGCQKEVNGTTEKKDNSGYYIKGKKDGTAFTYSAVAMARITDFSASAPMISLSLISSSNPTASSGHGLVLSVNFFDGKKPDIGTYTEDYSGNDYVAAGIYNANNLTISWVAGMHTPSVKPLVIRILTKTTKEITGTFEGAFYKQDSSIPAFYDDYTMITEGEFKLPLTQ